MKTSFVWPFSCGPETSIARSKNYAEQFHLSFDETILNRVFLAKVPNIFLGRVINSLFYKLLNFLSSKQRKKHALKDLMKYEL